MAKANSKVTKQSGRQSAKKQLAEIVGLYATAEAKREASAARQTEAVARIEREERRGITLKGKRLDQARSLLDDMNLAAVSIRELTTSAICSAGDVAERDAYLTAAQNSAMVICRKADVIAALLGGAVFGNFRDEFEVLTPERAAELERMER